MDGDNDNEEDVLIKTDSNESVISIDENRITKHNIKL